MKQACDIYTSSSSSPPLISPNGDQGEKKQGLKILETTSGGEKNQESTVPKVCNVSSPPLISPNGDQVEKKSKMYHCGYRCLDLW